MLTINHGNCTENQKLNRREMRITAVQQCTYNLSQRGRGILRARRGEAQELIKMPRAKNWGNIRRFQMLFRHGAQQHGSRTRCTHIRLPGNHSTIYVRAGVQEVP